MPAIFKTQAIPNLTGSASDIYLAFHGPFLLISRSHGVDVLVPSIVNHHFVWGIDPFLVLKNNSVVPPQDVRFSVEIPPNRDLVVQGLQPGTKRPAFDPKASLHLPPIAPPAQKAASLLAQFRLPWPEEVLTGRERVLEPNESYELSAGGVTNRKENKAANDEYTSLVHLLRYRGTGPANTTVVLHFHNEFADLATAQATNQANPNHDFEAFESVLPGLQIVANMPPDLKQNPMPADTFLPDINSAHWKSLYEVAGGADSVNCDGATGNC